MTIKNLALFKTLIYRFHQDPDEKLLACLPSEERESIMNEELNAADPLPFLELEEQLISRTHYSWLAPVILKLPIAIRAFTVAALPEPHSSKLRTLLHLDPMSIRQSLVVKKFFMNTLFKEWAPKETLPLAYVAKSQFTPLLALSKDKLIQLIDLLAMHDLAETLRHVLDKKMLENIYHCLSMKEQEFLRFCLRNKEKPAAPVLELDLWDGQPASFHHLLHRRGLARLGKAICNEPKEFVWYLVHLLDTGRGEFLNQYCKKASLAKADLVHLLCSSQVLSAFKFLQQQG